MPWSGRTSRLRTRSITKANNAANETWIDSVYLSTQTTLNSSSVLLERVQQSGVAADGNYSQTVTAPVPGLVPGNYYVIVLADSRGLVPELNRASTELASTGPVQVTLPALDARQPGFGHDRQRPEPLLSAYARGRPGRRDLRQLRRAPRRRALRWVSKHSVDEREPDLFDLADRH